MFWKVEVFEELHRVELSHPEHRCENLKNLATLFFCFHLLV